MADETQVQDPPKSAKLYQNLIKDGYTTQNLGSYEDFDKALQNPISANKIYSGLRSDGYTEQNLGTMQDFHTTFSAKKGGGAGSPLTSSQSPNGGTPSPATPTPDVPQDYWKHLNPQEKKALSQGTAQSQQTHTGETITKTPQQQIDDYNYAQTPIGKLVNGVKYIGQKVTKGGLQVVKGAAYAAALQQNATRGQFSGDDPVTDLALQQADKATDFLSKTSQGQVEKSKTMSNLGGLAEFLPSALAAESTGGATFYLQGLGQGKETMDQAEKNGGKINPVVKNAFILGSGAVNGLLMGDLGHGLFNSLGSSLKDDVVKNITVNAIKEAAGKDITAEGFHQLLKQGAKEWGDKALQVGVNYLKNTKRAVTDLSALNLANWGLKQGVDATNAKPVFNEDLGSLAQQEGETLKAAPLFGALGSVSDASKLTPFSEYKNAVTEGLIHDSSDQNTAKIKQFIEAHGRQEGWSPEEIQATNTHVDELAKITKSIPKGLPAEKANKAIDIVIGRNELQKQLEGQIQQRSALTAPFNEQPSAGEQLITDKIAQANDKLLDLANGTQTTYSKEKDDKGEETGKFLKTVWSKDKKSGGKTEEITESRYDLERLERDAKSTENSPINTEQNEKSSGGQSDQKTSGPEKSVAPKEEVVKPSGVPDNAPELVEKTQPTKIENFTDAKTINEGRKKIEGKIGTKKSDKYFEQVNKLINPNEHEIVDYRTNGVVTKEGDKYTFHPLADMDLKKWRLADFKTDVTDQFKKGETQNAIQEPGTESIPIQSETANSEGVPTGNTEGGEVAQKGEETNVSKEEVANEKATETTEKGNNQEGSQTPKNELELQHGDAEQPDKNLTSARNEDTDKVREKLGLSPLMKEAARANPTVWDEVLKTLDKNPNAPDDLIAELNHKMRPVTDTEQGLLTHREIELETNVQQAADRVNNGGDEWDKVNLANARQKLSDLLDIQEKVGREWGLSGKFRQQQFKDDFSLANLERQTRAALGGREFTTKEMDEIQRVHDEFTQKYKEYEKTIADLQEKNKKLQEENTLKKLTKESEYEQRKAKRAGKIVTEKEKRTQAIDDIRAKLKDIRKSGTLSSDLPYRKELAAIAPELAKLAKSYISEGITRLEDIVDKIHHDLEDVMPDLDKREVRDALSGYGDFKQLNKGEIEVKLRDLKRQARAISALEDIENGERPLKSGLEREKLSDEVKELQAKIKESMKEMGINPKTPQEHAKAQLDAVKTRLKNQIADIEKQLKTGEKPPSKGKVQYDIEAKALKSKRDYLKGQLEDAEKTGISDEQKVKNAISATKRSLDEYNRRIKEEDFKLKEKKQPLSSPELNALKAERDKVKKEFDELAKTSEQVANKAYITRMQNMTKELQERLKNGDFEKKVRIPTELTDEARKAQAGYLRVKKEYNTALERKRLSERPWHMKAADWFVKWRRGILFSNPSTFGKLGVYAAVKMLSKPINELTGSVVRKLPYFSKIAAKAPREGQGFNIQAEAKAFAQLWSKSSWGDIAKNIKGKEGDLEVVSGDKLDYSPDAPLLDIPAHLHSAIKQIPKHAEFERSLILRTKSAYEAGMDISNPLVQMKNVSEALKDELTHTEQENIKSKAYQDALRDILMADNVVSKSWRGAINVLDQLSESGKLNKYSIESQRIKNGAKALSTMLNVMLPITKVPVNFVIDRLEYTPIVGAAKALIVMTRWLEKMSPDDADYVMRIMKKQGIAVGMLAMGYLNPQAFGGFQVSENKRRPGQIKANDIKVFGVTLPHFMTHTGFLMTAQLGSTMRHIHDSYVEGTLNASHMKAAHQEGAYDATLASYRDLTKSIPFMETPKELSDAARNKVATNKFIADYITGLVLPPDLKSYARNHDLQPNGEPVKRDIKTLPDALKSNIPGLRKTLPRKH